MASFTFASFSLSLATFAASATVGSCRSAVSSWLKISCNALLQLGHVAVLHPNTAIEETAAAMAELYRAGKIRAIGVSNFNPAQMDAFRAVAPLHTVQPPYNLFEREHRAFDVLPYSRATAIDAGLRIALSGTAVRAHEPRHKLHGR